MLIKGRKKIIVERIRLFDFLLPFLRPLTEKSPKNLLVINFCVVRGIYV